MTKKEWTVKRSRTVVEYVRVEALTASDAFQLVAGGEGHVFDEETETTDVQNIEAWESDC